MAIKISSFSTIIFDFKTFAIITSLVIISKILLLFSQQQQHMYK